MQHVKVSISGNVQGVGFRYATQKTAKSLGIKGYVKNLPNGDVFVEAEGKDNVLNQFMRWLNEGPSHAKVHDFFYEEGEIVHYKSFNIR